MTVVIIYKCTADSLRAAFEEESIFFNVNKFFKAIKKKKLKIAIWRYHFCGLLGTMLLGGTGALFGATAGRNC